MEKMTYVGALNVALSDAFKAENPEAYDKLVALRASLEKKATAVRKPTAKDMANDALRDKVLDAMSFGSAYRVTDVAKLNEEFSTLSTQKLTAVLRTLKSMGMVTQFKVKGDSFYERVGE